MTMEVGVISLILLTPTLVWGYGSGAPSTACTSLTPGHGVAPRNIADATYKLNVTSAGGNRYNVRLEGTGFLVPANFKGFLIQIRKSSDDTVVGKFDIGASTVTKYLTCNNIQDSVTHSQSGTKSSVELTWNSGSYTGEVYGICAVVKDYSNYWVGLRSNPLTITESSTPQTTSTPTPNSTPVVTGSTGSQADDRSPAKVYSGCLATKGCFGSPSGCEETANCDILVTWGQGDNGTTNSSVSLELFSTKGTSRYAALALSTDSRMGEDLVFSCGETGGKVELKASWNTGSKPGEHKNNVMLPSFSVPDLLTSSINNGNNLYCKFRVPTLLSGSDSGSQSFSFQLNKGAEYYVLLAGGVYSGVLSYHDALFQVSSNKVDLQSFAGVRSLSPPLVKLHAILLSLAWLGFAGCGIIMARYYKETWRDSPCCGAAQWFQWHRFFMILTWVLTIVGVACIVAEVKGWASSSTGNPHAILGVVAFILVFLQPFIALLRPHPDSSSRWLFNWTHWLIGNTAHITAILAIFFAIMLAKAQLSGDVTWLVVAQVASYVLTHLLLSLNSCWADNTPALSSDVRPLAESGRGNFMEPVYINKDKRGGGARICIYCLYITSVICILIMVIWSIVVGPNSIFI